MRGWAYKLEEGFKEKPVADVKAEVVRVRGTCNAELEEGDAFLMIRTIIFDLSEVLIAGLVGIEKSLAPRLHLPEERVLMAFAGDSLQDLCRGRISEDVYLAAIIERQQWDVSADTLKQTIRQNLRCRVPGMEEILRQLAPRFGLILFSDHGQEWVEYVRSVHPFLEVFEAQMFSFETGRLKSEPAAFRALLEVIGRDAEECLFVDDSLVNVETAREVGISGIQFTGVREFVARLADHGVIV